MVGCVAAATVAASTSGAGAVALRALLGDEPTFEPAGLPLPSAEPAAGNVFGRILEDEPVAVGGGPSFTSAERLFVCLRMLLPASVSAD